MERRGRINLLLALGVGAVLFLSGCGYQFVGRGGQFPAGVDRIAVPIFDNRTSRVEIARLLTDNFIKELLATGKVAVVPPPEAQAEIRGTVTECRVKPITFDVNHRALENRLTVTVDVSLVFSGEDKPAFSEKGLSVQHDYPIRSSLAGSTREEEEAMEYVSRELSQKIISLLTEGF